jgi:hypothetical protein
MSKTLDEAEMVRRFENAFPNKPDFYSAVGFFRASGLQESDAHALAERMFTQRED